MGANRCPNCNKFVGIDTDSEPQEERSDVEPDNSEVQYEFVIANNCADCGTEITSGTVEVNVGVKGLEEHANSHGTESDCEEEGFEFSVELNGCERDVRTVGTGRGQQTFYVVKVNATVTCSCGWHAEGEGTGEIPATDMESC